MLKKIAGSEEDQRERAESPDLFSTPLEEKENPAKKKVHLTLFLKIQYCVAWVLVQNYGQKEGCLLEGGWVFEGGGGLLFFCTNSAVVKA